MHLALGPYFDAYTKGQEGQNNGRINKFVDAEAKTGTVPMVFTWDKVPRWKSRLADDLPQVFR